jgi:hypothetical protein
VYFTQESNDNLEEHINSIFRVEALPDTYLMLVSSLGYSSTLKMEETHSSERVTDFQQTTWHYITDDRTLRNHCCQTSNPTTLETCDGIRRIWSSGEIVS